MKRKSRFLIKEENTRQLGKFVLHSKNMFCLFHVLLLIKMFYLMTKKLLFCLFFLDCWGSLHVRGHHTFTKTHSNYTRRTFNCLLLLQTSQVLDKSIHLRGHAANLFCLKKLSEKKVLSSKNCSKNQISRMTTVTSPDIPKQS